MFKIFDTHTHTYPEAIAERACSSLAKFYDFPVDNTGTYSHLESMARENGVAGFLLFSVATNAHQVQSVNTSIANLMMKSRDNGFKTVGFAGMYQDYPDFEGEIDRAISLGLTGVKIHPDIQGVDIDDKKLLPLYEIMEAKGMKLYLHMGDDRPQYRFSTADKLVNVMNNFPRLSVVAAHLGGYKAYDYAVPMLAGRDNLMYDTSSSLWVISAEKAEKIIRTLGVENVMFGTDYPVKNITDEIPLFMKINLTDAEREDILWNNAARYFELDKI